MRGKKALTHSAKVLLRLGVTCACLATLAYYATGTIDWKDFMRIPPSLLALTAVVTFLQAYLTALRWKVLNPTLTREIAIWGYFRLMVYGRAFNLIMPGALGGDFLRSAMIMGSVSSDRAKNAISVFSDRVVGFLSVVLIGGTATVVAPAVPHRIRYILVYWCLVAAGAVCFSVAGPLFAVCDKWLSRECARPFCRRIAFIAKLLREILAFYRRNPSRVGVAVMLSVPIHGLFFLLCYLAARRAEIYLPASAIIMITSLVWLASAIPISMSGFGVREASTVFLLGSLGVPLSHATTYTIYMVGLVLLGAMAAFVYVCIDLLLRSWQKPGILSATSPYGCSNQAYNGR